MPLEYLLNVMSMLERQAPEFFLMALQRGLIERLVGAKLSAGLPEAAGFDDPVEWLRATPLMRALADAAEQHARPPEPSAESSQAPDSGDGESREAAGQ